MAKARVIKFFVLAGYIKCLLSEGWSSLEGAWRGSRDPF